MSNADRLPPGIAFTMRKGALERRYMVVSEFFISAVRRNDDWVYMVTVLGSPELSCEYAVTVVGQLELSDWTLYGPVRRDKARRRIGRSWIKEKLLETLKPSKGFDVIFERTLNDGEELPVAA